MIESARGARIRRAVLRASRGVVLAVSLTAAMATAAAAAGHGSRLVRGTSTPTQAREHGSGTGLVTIPLLPANKPEPLTTPSGVAYFTLNVPRITEPYEFVARILVRGPVTGGTATITTASNTVPEALRTVNGVSTITAPLSPADVQNAQVTIEVQVQLNLASAGVCTTPPSTVAVIESAVGVLTGTLVLPHTLADFWPPSLQRVAIYAPDLGHLSPAAARAAAEATLQAAATVSESFGPNTAIAMHTGTPPPTALSPLVRTVQVVNTSRGPSSALDLAHAGRAPVLRISGRGAGLVAAARAIAPTQLALATAPEVSGVRAGALGPSPGQVTVGADGSRTITLAQLGTQTSIEGSGTTQITQALSEYAFGTPIARLQVRVSATYTPPPYGGVANFAVIVGNYIVNSVNLGSAGVLHLVGDVPTSVLNRNQDVLFRLTYTPPGGQCRFGGIPVQVTMNPNSGFVATPGETLPAGFIRSPQDLATTMPFALVSLDDATLRAAAMLAVALAQYLPAPPTVTVVSTTAALNDHRPVVVVGGTPALGEQLHVPLQLAPFRTIAPDYVQVGYRLSQPFACLEEFVSGGRDVIFLGAYERPALQIRLAAAILAEPDGWLTLGTDQLAVDTSGGRLRLLSTSALLPATAGLNAANGIGIPRWLLALIGVVLALVVTRVTWLLARRRRLRLAAERAQRQQPPDAVDATVPAVDRQDQGPDES